LSLRSDDLDSVGEFYTENDFRQLVVAIEAGPASLGGLGEFEDHGGRRLVRETSLGTHVRWRMVAWITSKEAKSLFSQMEDQYAFGEMAEVGKQNLASFASVLGDGCLFEFMQVEDRVSFIRKSGGAAR
jgi:hypothetical protein